MPDGTVLDPIVIGAEIDMEDPSKLTLVFCDTYSASDEAMKLVNILGEAVSVGQRTAANWANFNSFIDTGASTSVRDFMQSAIDYTKNAILAGNGQGIVIDGSGITLRKENASGSGYELEQIKMINNSIVFSKDNWSTVQMAIGKFHDENAGDIWGVVAPAIVGTMIAGSNMVIESAKKDGGVAVFRVDADGAKLYNSRFDLVNEYSAGSSGQISLIPHIGFVGGKTTSTTPLFSFDENGNPTGLKTVGGNTITSAANIKKDDLPNANFYVDMDGNAYFKGTVIATDGKFTGAVYATSGEFSGTLKATKLEGELVGANGGAIKGVSLGIGGRNYDNFMVDSNGNVTMQGNINLSGGTITWGNNLPEYDSYTDQDAENLLDRVYAITTTKLGSASIESPEITGNNIKATRAFKVGLSDGYMGRAKGRAIIDDGWGPTTMTTFGVAMASGGTLDDGTITFNSDGNYVIATDGGARLTSNSSGSRSDVTTTSSSATMSYNDKSMIRVDSSGCHYTTDGKNWKDIGSGSGGNVVAVWGS